jgi:hypothetical protein
MGRQTGVRSGRAGAELPGLARAGVELARPWWMRLPVHVMSLPAKAIHEHDPPVPAACLRESSGWMGR